VQDFPEPLQIMIGDHPADFSVGVERFAVVVVFGDGNLFAFQAAGIEALVGGIDLGVDVDFCDKQRFGMPQLTVFKGAVARSVKTAKQVALFGLLHAARVWHGLENDVHPGFLECFPDDVDCHALGLGGDGAGKRIPVVFSADGDRFGRGLRRQTTHAQYGWDDPFHHAFLCESEYSDGGETSQFTI
jgi:hypothetical protein